MAVKLSASRYEEIKREVISLFEECEIHSFPISGLALAGLMHYRVIPYSSLELEAFLDAYDESQEGFCKIEKRDNGIYEYVIYYNDNEADQRPERQNWTILHEIGHIYLGHLDNHPKPYHIAEAEANFFAKYAIAPPPLVDYMNCRNADDIMETFRTSREASRNVLEYYNKWLQYGPRDYEPFERELLSLFHSA